MPQLIIVGPRFTTNLHTADTALGISRQRYAHVPLVVLQNKMYSSREENTGNLEAKLQWTRGVGAAAAFTWLTRNEEFSQRSSVPHYRLPFAADACRNDAYRRSIAGLAAQLRNGNSLANAMQADPCFPHTLPRIVRLGEQSGKLGDMLEQANTLYDTSLEQGIERLLPLLEPVLMLLLGVLVGGLVAVLVWRADCCADCRDAGCLFRVVGRRVVGRAACCVACRIVGPVAGPLSLFLLMTPATCTRNMYGLRADCAFAHVVASNEANELL